MFGDEGEGFDFKSRPKFDFKQLKGKGSTPILLGVTALVVLIAFMVTIQVDEVKGTDAGVLVNNITGSITPVPTGKKIYNGLYQTLYTVDKTEQTLDMSQDSPMGDDRVRIKTSDGSDVQLQLTVQYAIVPGRADIVLLHSGIDQYKLKWARDYSRSICRSIFGELTTEEFYDTAKRNEKAARSKIALNDRLTSHGIEVTSVIPGDFNFYKEYEEKIMEKKMADQQVQEEQSKANAAIQDQKRQEVEAEKKMEVAIAAFTGQMKELIVSATADAERVKRSAEAYEIKTKADAEAEYYTRQKNAEALLAKAQAEAQGVKKMAEALQGEGGVNIVKVEYAKQLSTMNITGQPFTRAGHSDRVEWLAGRAPAETPADATEGGR